LIVTSIDALRGTSQPVALWCDAAPARAAAGAGFGTHLDERNDALGELWKARDEKTAWHAPVWQQARADLPPGWTVDPADPMPTDGARVGTGGSIGFSPDEAPHVDPVRWVVNRTGRGVVGGGGCAVAEPKAKSSTIPDLRARGVSGEVLATLQSGGDRVAAALFAYLGVGSVPTRTFV